MSKKSNAWQAKLQSVGVKLSLSIIASSLFFVIFMGIASYQISKNVMQTKVTDASLQTIVQAGQKLDFLYQLYQKLALQLVMDAPLHQQVSKASKLSKDSREYNENMSTLETTLSAYIYSNDGIQSMELFTPAGDIIQTKSSLMSQKNYAAQDWFKAIVAKDGDPVWLSSKLKDNRITSSVITVGSLIHQANSEEFYVALFDVSLDIVKNQLSHIQLGDTGIIQVLDGSGLVIYSQNASQMGAATGYPLSVESMSKKSDSFLSSDADQQIVLSKSEATGWFTVGIIPIDDLTKDMKIIYNLTIIFSLCALVLAAGIGYLVARMIGKPLNHIRNLMEDGAGGDLRIRVQTNAKDEIGQLGTSFDTMMKQITELFKQTTHSSEEVLVTAAELSASSKQTAASANEIAVAINEISSGASGLASQSERGNELTIHIGQQISSVVEANGVMGIAAEEMQSSSRIGTQYMEEVIAKTSMTEEITRSMVDKVDKLKESTLSIRKVLDILSQMTKQTNILSLNATIEAARAGEAGKGFMVVADEIRKLADQSRKSIETVGQITETIQNEIIDTVTVLSEAYPIFQEQIHSVKEADLLFKQVQGRTVSFIEQLGSVSQTVMKLEESQFVLSDTMMNVSAVSEQSLANSEQVASLSSEQLSISKGLVQLSDKLEKLSVALQDSLSKFKV
ncbi:methyl-accepting chemotaxis protein [Paenibacillus marchantiophytorum]|uniref:Methyl-accepting chemotaxis protein n=1 Tax=Paenibacillus marchantiophytorum TaxID=1619310 RepID=A0ABQ2BQE1_9BACL|nr:methyl-accepting chemotaxis protein [Paenibacillus marchantiophytorum]GGI43582.1 methyl-accepting chemotaxis protein [Paenibacillus marchantiophytorum]